MDYEFVHKILSFRNLLMCWSSLNTYHRHSLSNSKGLYIYFTSLYLKKIPCDQNFHPFELLHLPSNSSILEFPHRE